MCRLKGKNIGGKREPFSANDLGLFTFDTADTVIIFQNPQLRECTTAGWCGMWASVNVGAASAALNRMMFVDRSCVNLTVQIAAAGDQRLRIGMNRIVDHFVCGAVLYDSALIHHAYFIRKVCGSEAVMADKNQTGLVRFGDIVEKIDDIRPDGNVQHRHGFIGQQ